MSHSGSGMSSQDVTLVGTGGEGRRADELIELSRGTVVGRYVILDKLGAGGMGVVYAAYDPELDRKVALKLLVNAQQASHSAGDGRSRLLREAQALAKLSHPNVVTIHDVGTMDEQVWLAMEFVEGRTLGAWLSEQPRNWRAIREVLAAAGSGLAAAHAKGLLHRDFKPENLMVGRDGRVRVMDFGLARAAEDAPEKQASLLYESAVRDATTRVDPALLLDSEVTRDGTLLGTPAYLAPEVFRGDGWGASADQFAFCVTLWEALYGERPFAGDNLVELAAHVIEGKLRTPPGGREVPGWLRRVCTRGLAIIPEQRYPDMGALLLALQNPGRERRKRMAIVAGLAALAAGVWGWQDLSHRSALRACEAQAAPLEQSWNDDARERLGAALRAPGTPYAQQTAARVTRALDRHAEAWRGAHARACETHIQTGGDTLPAPVAACFTHGVEALETLTEVLASGGKEVLRHAVVGAVELPPASACVDAAASDASARPTRRELVQARILLEAEQLEDAETLARAELERANAAQEHALMPEAHYLLGAAARGRGAFETAENELRRAYFDALRLGFDELAIEAALELTHLHSVGRIQFELADLWLISAREIAARTDPPDPRVQAKLTAAAAALATERGDYEVAETQMLESIELLERAYGSAHPDIGLMYGHLSELRDDAGDFEGAEQAGNKSLKLLGESLGETHPDNSQAVFSLATAAWKTGRGEESLELSKRALELREAAFGPNHVSVAEALNSVGNAHMQLGQLSESHAAHSRALEIRKSQYGPDEPRVATSLVNLADVAMYDGRPDEAIEYARGSLRIWESKLGKDHDYNSYAHIAIGGSHLRAERYAEALEAFNRALEIRRAGQSSESQLAEPMTGVGEALLGLGRNAEALEVLEAAWAIRLRNPTEAMQAPDTGFALARALWLDPATRKRAHEVGEVALENFGVVSKARPKGYAAVQAWLEAHPAPTG